MKTRTVEKAGVIAFTSGEHRNVLICAALGSTSYWVLPKGHCEPGETHEQTAVREAAEEIGWNVILIDTPPIGLTSTVSVTEAEIVEEHVLFYAAEIDERVGEGERILMQVDVLTALQTLGNHSQQQVLFEMVKQLAKENK